MFLDVFGRLDLVGTPVPALVRHSDDLFALRFTEAGRAYGVKLDGLSRGLLERLREEIDRVLAAEQADLPAPGLAAGAGQGVG